MTARGATLLAVLIGATTSGAEARPAEPVPTPLGRCVAWFDSYHLAEAGAERAMVDALPDGGCRYRDVRLVLSLVEYRVATIEVHGIDVDPMRNFGPPMPLHVEARGITDTGRGVGGTVGWVLYQERRPFDIVFDAVVDPQTHVARLNEFSLTGESFGRAELDGEVDGLDDIDADHSGVRFLHLRLDSATFVSTFVLPPVLGGIGDGDPASVIGRDKIAVAGVLRGVLPHADANVGSIDAISGFVGDFPIPKHPFDLTIDAPHDPLTVRDGDLLSQGAPEIASVMSKLRIVATYAGSFTDRPAR